MYPCLTIGLYGVSFFSRWAYLRTCALSGFLSVYLCCYGAACVMLCCVIVVIRSVCVLCGVVWWCVGVCFAFCLCRVVLFCVVLYGVSWSDVMCLLGWGWWCLCRCHGVVSCGVVWCCFALFVGVGVVVCLSWCCVRCVSFSWCVGVGICVGVGVGVLWCNVCVLSCVLWCGVLCCVVLCCVSAFCMCVFRWLCL